MLKLWLLALLALSAICSESIQLESSSSDDKSFRLPNSTRPESYSVELILREFDVGELQYSGHVAISILIRNDTRTITLHNSNNIVITSVFLMTQNNSQVMPSTYEIEEQREFLIVSTPVVLESGAIVNLAITFVGQIGNDSSTTDGLYRGSYLHNGSERRYYIASNVQPIYARRVFPCYDEPSFKAHFSLSITHNSRFQASSNARRTGEQPIGQRQLRSDFETTPLMPTYLLAFIVSDFEIAQMNSTNDVVLRVHSRPEGITNTTFALQTASRLLELYENAFAIKYAQAKLDQVALPDPIITHEMANNGIIFYRENLLLLESSAAHDMRNAAAAIAEKVCQQLIGNRLTPVFWHVVWLSVGFCRFYEYYMTAKLFPLMRMEELFALEVAQRSLSLDSSLAARPMTSYIESSSGIVGLFDDIAYGKSASVLRMFFYSLTEETFHNGLKIYLNESTWLPEGVAEPKHLYNALQQASDDAGANYNIQELFHNWEHQAGYPVVFVERSYNNHRIRFTQYRFIDAGTDTASTRNGTSDTLWHIPITYASKVDPPTTPSSTATQFWLSERQHEIALADVTPSSYFLVNIQQTGYYRVQYDEANWMLIARELSRGNLTSIPPNNRAMLIDDAAAFVGKRMLRVRILLELIKYLQYDIDFIPWKAATNKQCLKYMWHMLYDDDSNSQLSQDFAHFLQILLTQTFDSFGAKVAAAQHDGAHYHKDMRDIAINWACQVHLPSCLNDTRDKFREFMRGNGLGDHEAAIFCNGLRSAGRDEFDFMWNLFNSTSERTRRALLLRSMGCIENEELLTRFITQIINGTDNSIDNRDNNEWMTIITSVYANGPIGLRVVMEFLRLHYEPLMELADKASSIEVIFRDIATRINSRTLWRQLKGLLVIYGIHLNESTTDAINAVVEANLNWIDNYSSDIQLFLNGFLRSGSSSPSPSSSSFAISCSVIVFGLVFNWIMQN